MKKKSIAFALSLILIVSLFAPSAYAADTGANTFVISPRYTNISTFSVSFSISSTGLASCYSKVIPSSVTYNTSLTIELQRYSNGSWSTIKTWTGSGDGVYSLDKTHYVTSGYSYRIYVTAQISAKGILRESVSTTSSTVKY